MSKSTVRSFQLFWVFCFCALAFVLTSLYANAAETYDPTTGRNAYDVMVSGRDIGVIAVILALFMSSLVTITVLNNKNTLKVTTIHGDSVARLAEAINEMGATISSSTFANAQNTHNAIEATTKNVTDALKVFDGRMCFAGQILQDLAKDAIRKSVMTETTTHTVEKPI